MGLKDIRECAFCAITHDGAPDNALEYYPEYGVWIIEPLNPVVPGHVIVVPEHHVKDALENSFVTAYVTRCATWYARTDQKYNSCNFITSVGEPATQSVFHLHIHIVPRVEGDGLTLPWTGQVK